MSFLKGTAFLLLTILSINIADNLGKEKYLQSERGNDRIQHDAKGIERRFVDDLDDKDWHVSHLKDVDFPYETGCKEETFTDKVNKYKKTLKEDGSLVTYVSADALPVNDDDIVDKKCVKKNVNNVKKKAKHNETKQTDQEHITTKEVDTATTVDLKDTVKEKAKVTNATQEKSRRASEYQFSSAEYFDEVDEFQDLFCPDFVEVIHLEIDILRNYDLECELTLEWRSLQ